MIPNRDKNSVRSIKNTIYAIYKEYKQIFFLFLLILIVLFSTASYSKRKSFLSKFKFKHWANYVKKHGIHNHEKQSTTQEPPTNKLFFNKNHPFYKTRQALEITRESHKLDRIYTKSDFKTLSGILSSYNLDHFWQQYLTPLLVTRVAGTEDLKKVEKHILANLPDFYDVKLDVFKKYTGLGDVREFRNIIATSDALAERQLVISCHHDSKYWPNKNETFIGATDSSVPCAMILQLANTLDKLVLKSKNLALTFIFFDGEEAFVKWTNTDSVYGSKHLVNLWSAPEKSPQNEKLGNSQKIRKIDRIDAFILLDLLGAANPKFYHDKRFAPANSLFRRFCEIERAAKYSKYLTTEPTPNSNKLPYFFSQNSIGKTRYGIDDDHMPWYKAGVSNILHLIPIPFPHVWHTKDDDESALDRKTIYKLQMMLDIFVVEYLGLIE